MSRRLRILTLALLLAAWPATAFAETYEWAADVPKGMDGGIVCMATATSGGNTYRYTNYVGADADEPADRERRWQISACDRYAREDVANLFRFKWGQEIDPASVTVTWEPYRE